MPSYPVQRLAPIRNSLAPILLIIEGCEANGGQLTEEERATVARRVHEIQNYLKTIQQEP